MKKFSGLTIFSINIISFRTKFSNASLSTLKGILDRESLTSELAPQADIVRLRLESETFLPTHECWVSISSAQCQCVARRHKEYCNSDLARSWRLKPLPYQVKQIIFY